MHHFYLGTQNPEWLWNGGARGPLAVGAQSFKSGEEYPSSVVPFILESGSYFHLLREGRWTLPAQSYAELALKLKIGTGKLEWAGVQDWGCAPALLSQTGKTVEDHQQLTVLSYLELRRIAPRVSWVPALHGLTKQDYLQHVEMYRAKGVSLESLDLIAVGSVTKQTSDETVDLFETLSSMGLPLHGSGIRLEGLRRLLPFLRSSDSRAEGSEQSDGEAYRRQVTTEVKQIQDYLAYDGILGFFGENED